MYKCEVHFKYKIQINIVNSCGNSIKISTLKAVYRI